MPDDEDAAQTPADGTTRKTTPFKTPGEEDPHAVRVTVHTDDAEGPGAVEAPQDAPTGFGGAFAKAKKLAEDPRRAHKLIEEARKKATKDQGALGMVWEELQTLFAFVRDSVTGKYKPTWTSLVIAITAIVYFLSPLDVIPDFIVGLGYLDDAAIIGFAIKNIRDQLTAYKTWKAGGESIGDARNDGADAQDVGAAAKV